MQEVGDRVLVSGCVGKVFSSTSLEIIFQDYLRDAPKKIAALIWIFSLRAVRAERKKFFNFVKVSYY